MANRPNVIVIRGNEEIILLEANAPFVAPWPAVVMSRGRYLELIKLEMQWRAGQLTESER